MQSRGDVGRQSTRNYEKITIAESVIEEYNTANNSDGTTSNSKLSESSKTQHVLRMVELFRSQYENNSKALRKSILLSKKLLERVGSFLFNI